LNYLSHCNIIVHMPYQLFLDILLQLSSNKKAVITLDNGTIYIHPLREKNKWRIHMPLSHGDKSILRALMPHNGILRLDSQGPHLELDPSSQTLQLVDEIQIQKDKYITFKKQLDEFIRLSQEWQEIVAALA
jgi:Tir chaperone protein (CesT) family